MLAHGSELIWKWSVVRFKLETDLFAFKQFFFSFFFFWKLSVGYLIFANKIGSDRNDRKGGRKAPISICGCWWQAQTKTSESKNKKNRLTSLSTCCGPQTWPAILASSSYLIGPNKIQQQQQQKRATKRNLYARSAIVLIVRLCLYFFLTLLSLCPQLQINCSLGENL